MQSFILALLLIGTALAAPQRELIRESLPNEVRANRIIPILRFDEENLDGGGYKFEYETENGIIREQEGQPLESTGSIAKRGSWSYNLDDGTRAEFNFVADEGGFQVNSPLIPAVPAWVQEQIDRAARERAAGIIHDGRWDPELYNTGEHDGKWDPERYN